MDIQRMQALSKFLENINILYVEDDDYLRDAILEILHVLVDVSDLKITTAVNGKDGLEKYIESKTEQNLNPIDIIITDINMPIMNGLEMIEAIKNIDKDIPIIVLSAHSDSKYFIQCISLGINNFLLKPLDMDDFFTTLENTLEQYTLASKLKANLQLLKEYQETIDNASIVSKTDLNGIITYVNDEFCQVSKYTREELIGQNHNIIRDSEVPSSIFTQMWDTIKNKKQIFKAILKNKTKDGNSYYVDATIKPILNSEGEITEYISILNNITQQINTNKEVQKLHAYDTQQQHIAREKIETGIKNDFNDNESKIIFKPLDILGGDFYSLYKCNNGTNFIYIIDGQGHGISPALTIFAISSIINNTIETVSNLQELTDKIFPIIKTFLGEIEQLSFSMIMISADKKTISYCSGGMYPFLVKTDNEVIKLKANNTPFMSFSDTPQVEEVLFDNWESLFVFSDGFIEHQNEELVNITPLELINNPLLIDKYTELLLSSQLEDDLSIIYLKNIIN